MFYDTKFKVIIKDFARWVDDPTLGAYEELEKRREDRRTFNRALKTGIEGTRRQSLCICLSRPVLCAAL